MIILLSPAKTLNFESIVPSFVEITTPKFSREAIELIDVLRKFQKNDLAKLMKLSDKLAELNFDRFKNFDHNNKQGKPCLYAYDGDVYNGIECNSYNKEEIDFATNHLRILSGLYGILKPLDSIQAYRLEMSIPLKNSFGSNLYDFWTSKITNELNNEKGEFIINLASNEYSSVIDLHNINKKFINISFKVLNNGEYKNIGLYSKKARGLMANFMIKNSVNSPDEIKLFCQNNYKFSELLSSSNEYVFLKD